MHVSRLVPTILIASGAAILVAIAAGPFFTGLLPLPARTLFWASLISLNALKWTLWFWLVPPLLPAHRHWLLPVAGALLLNASLPLEVGFTYRAIGVGDSPDGLQVYGIAVLISGLVSAIIWVSSPRAARVRDAPAHVQDEAPAAQPPRGLAAQPPRGLAAQPPRGLAAQPPRGLAARVPLGKLLAITAEDHYIRLHLATGEKPLILYRFADAMADLAGTDGVRIHRGAWVASNAVAGASRHGRRWALRLADGTEIPVSQSRLAAVREKGWLGR